ncbi:baseplate J-like protein [Ruminiclostridium hungatei]|uniref:Baseplate J-like protein n=1 Tax=Ruminiclostridium hungatei TaxID=48256 RepID=A0A1V4SMF6_RUMHU|nr:baseplate J/gp47 family protein [Ruminiclostridium hungatei]OPX45072.1 baseplate J-like protein [Ruminiclostridium hungatei]
MSDINFVTVDSGEILNNLIKAFEEHMGETLYPGDERRQFLYNFVPVLVSAYNSINNTGRGNLLRYASGEVLDSLGEFWDCTRLPAQRARVTLKFSLSAAQTSSTHIPAGTRATPDGTIYFATLQELVIPAGQNQGTVTAKAQAGAQLNFTRIAVGDGQLAGQSISDLSISDITIYAVDKETNIVTSSGTTVNIEQAVQLINKVVEVQLENTSLQKRVDDITIAITALMGGAI